MSFFYLFNGNDGGLKYNFKGAFYDSQTWFLNQSVAWNSPTISWFSSGNLMGYSDLVINNKNDASVFRVLTTVGLSYKENSYDTLFNNTITYLSSDSVSVSPIYGYAIGGYGGSAEKWLVNMRIN